ncbi:MAG: VWA domain-containing protein, partial [Candidatus Aminicenantales bacterium]
MGKRLVIAGTVAAGAAIVLLATAGQAPQTGEQERPLRHDAAAIVKLVPVRVLGQDNRPVTGLRKEDFVLYEDGQRKTITEFEVHAMTDAGMTVEPGPPRAAEPAVRASGAMNRKIFIFLDQQASDRAGKDKARAAALRFLDSQVRPGDLVGVLGFYSMSGFYIREYLTSDMNRIRRAIEGPTETRPSGGEWVAPLPDDMEFGAEVAILPQNLKAALAAKEAEFREDAGGGSGGAVVFAPGTAAFQRVDFIPRLVDVVEVFKLIPGNKSLILFTARDMGSEAEKLGQLFGATGTAVYAVNTQDWDYGPFGTKFKKIWWDHSLKDLSAASGGKYFADINEAAAIAQDLQSLTGNFYVLGYYVRESWEGKYHKIRVEVARPGTRVLVQDGYADSKPFAQMSEFEKDVQLIDLTWSDRPVSAFLGLAVDPLIVLQDNGARACLLTRLEINAKAGAPPVRSEIFAFLKDDAGKTKLARRWEVDLSRYEGQSLCAHLSVPVSAGGWDFRVVVRDLV